MSTATDRLEQILTQTCRIERSATSKETTYLDMQLGTWALVDRQRAAKCLLVAGRVSDDMLAVGPVERNLARLFLLAGANIEAHDQVTIEDTIWTVEDPPDAKSYRGEAHHIEALVTKKAVQ